MTLSFSLDVSSEALKFKYTPQNLTVLGYHNNPWLAMVPKMESFGGGGMGLEGLAYGTDGTGKGLPIPIWHATGQGHGNDIAQAQANQSDSKFEEFILRRARYYGVHELSRAVLKSSVGREHAFLEAQGAVMDELIYNMTRNMANDLYKDGSGSRGVVGSGEATPTITLEDPEDIVNFELGMFIEATSGSSFGTVHTGGAAVAQITGIDRDAGTLTTTGNWTALITDPIAAGDHLFVRGDAQATFAAARKVVGLAGWLPSTAPAPTDNFFGVDRSVDVTRLAGIRHDGSSQSVEEAIIDTGTKMFREGARPDLTLINPVQFAELAKSLQGKAEYSPVSSPDGVVSFSSLKVRTGAGEVSLLSDPNCPVNRAYMLQTNTWKLYCLGPMIELIDEDGLTMMRKAASDDYEVRFASYCQLGCNAPGKNAVVTLA